LGEWDFAVIAELVFVDVRRPGGGGVGVDVRAGGEAELAAYIVFFYDGPAGLAGIKVEGGGISYAMQGIRDEARKVAGAT